MFSHLYQSKTLVPVVLLAFFWFWETGHPFFGWQTGRWLHAVRNISLALFNALILGLFFATATVVVADWTTRNQFGVLSVLGLNHAMRFALAIVVLDLWMYGWHRANHAIPLLWRFHRMHHSDNKMDVTTATRFHLGEHMGANVLRLALIPLVGFQLWHIITYDTLVIALTQFHHADISLGRCDRWLRTMIVTPDMHKMHHSRWRPETDSNFSTIFSVWDRMARTFRMRSDPHTLEYGLKEFDEARWQTFWGMLKTPFINVPEKTESTQSSFDPFDADVPTNAGWPEDSYSRYDRLKGQNSASQQPAASHE